jgi:alkaline phosphatase
MEPTMSARHTQPPAISRRRFLKAGAAAAVGTVLAPPASEDFSFGIVADVHYADKPPGGARHYRDSIEKIRRCVQTFNTKKLSFAVSLGDIIDKAKDRATELGYLRTITAEFGKFKGPRHFVIGNHDVATLDKKEFSAICRVAAGPSSFDSGRYHFVVLDANFKKDGTAYDAGNFGWRDTWIHPPQREWLKRDLAKARDRKTIVFVHQNLHDEKNAHGVNNAPETRKVLEEAGNVLAVIQGHNHAGGLKKINGIHYFTLKAMVEGPGLENNAYAIVHVDAGGRLRIEGFGRQKDLTLA